MKKSKGVTLISLMIVVIILIIIAGITVYTGKNVLKKAQLEELRTNMLMVQAKAKEYVELANFKMGINPTAEKRAAVRQEIYEGQAKLQKAEGTSVPTGITITNDMYKVTEETLKEWGLEKLEINERNTYLINFDDTNATVEIYNTKGINGKYSLTEIDAME